MPINPTFPTAGATNWDAPLNTALDEMVDAINANESRPYQYVPPVGSTFTSSFWGGNTTSTLRDRSGAPMPLLLSQTISVDQVSFNLTVLATTAGQTGQIDLMTLSGSTWSVVQNLADDFPLLAPATTGVQTFTFSPVVLTAGVIYGVRLFENQAFDSALRVSSGTLTGPGINPSSSSWTTMNFPIGANAATVTAVPIIKLRRSA